MGNAFCYEIDERDIESNLRHTSIERQLLRDGRKDKHLIKLLLLGPANSGKSTILKQMKIIRMNGFKEEELKCMKYNIYHNILTAMKTLVLEMGWMDIVLTNPKLQRYAITIGRIPLSNIYEEDRFRTHIANMIRELWEDPGVKQCYQYRDKFNIPPSAGYFLDHLDRICQETYVPTYKDVLNCRVQTTEIQQLWFTMKNFQFCVTDVGGQRGERKKWLHLFDDTKSILFIVALSEYDQVMNEDLETNRMEDSLDLFDSISNNTCFQNKYMILFLNKKDLFKTKLDKVPLTIAFENYTGGPNFHQACVFVAEEFAKKRRKNACAERELYTHFTCATDTTQIQVVIDASLDQIITKFARTSGLL